MDVKLDKVQKLLEWVGRILKLDFSVTSSQTRPVRRGQVYRCDFGVGVGSEMQKDRPAVIVQNPIGNLRSSNTIVIPITHSTKMLPCIVPLAPQYEADGVTVRLDGQANASNIMCVSRARLGVYICDLPAGEMKAIDEALAKSLGLMYHYADLEKKLADKLEYIERVKAQRNQAQDSLMEIYRLFQVDPGQDISVLLDTIKKQLDK